MATDGITRLIAASQLKSANANDLKADLQRSIISEQKSLRAVQSALEEVNNRSDIEQFVGGLFGSDRGVDEASVSTPAAYLDRFSRLGFETSSPFSPTGLAKSLDVVASSVTRYASGLHAFVEALKKTFEESAKDLEGEDKLGSFEINTIMSDYNEAVTLARTIKKKTDDANASVISKIG